jgi:hypothetical protein
VLDDLALDFGVVPEDAVRFSGAFSVVVDESTKRIRRLPSLYFRYAQLFASRDIAEVLRRLEATVNRFLVADERPLYLLNACELDGQPGLYGRDLFNRAPFRRKLLANGLRMAEDPFVQLNGKGFCCADWGTFSARFIVHDVLASDDPSLFRLRGASLLYWLNGLRLGTLTVAHLGALGQMLTGITAVNARDPDNLVAELRRIM